MEPIKNIPDTAGKKRVVIVGGGFAGLELARRLDRKYFQVVMIDKVNYFQFQPLFYQVATGGLEPSSITYPHRMSFRRHRGIYFRMCKALRTVPEKKVLETSIGYIEYDRLVIATGCGTNYFGNDTLKDTTFALKSISEALLLRNRILLSLEEAVATKDEARLG